MEFIQKVIDWLIVFLKKADVLLDIWNKTFRKHWIIWSLIIATALCYFFFKWALSLPDENKDAEIEVVDEYESNDTLNEEYGVQ
jgi:hypothetical protein